MIQSEVDSLRDFNAQGSDDCGFEAESKQLETLLSDFDTLEHLARKRKMGSQAELDAHAVKYLAVKCRTLALKSK